MMIGQPHRDSGQQFGPPEPIEGHVQMQPVTNGHSGHMVGNAQHMVGNATPPSGTGGVGHIAPSHIVPSQDPYAMHDPESAGFAPNGRASYCPKRKLTALEVFALQIASPRNVPLMYGAVGTDVTTFSNALSLSPHTVLRLFHYSE